MNGAMNSPINHPTNTPILVAYASETGSTAGVAEAIGEALRESAVPVEVRHMREVRDITPYRAVVAGSAIQGGEWLPEAMRFMRTHQAELAARPFAAFLVCMTLAMPYGEKFRQGVGQWLDPVRRLARPVSEGLFAGALDIGKIPSAGQRLKFRLSVTLGIWAEGDHRDWDSIRAWAVALKPKLVREARGDAV